ncbi:MAG: ATP-binding cassette domain-containing protein, partial [Alphaproteobacteria bacterium]|nr:ATP-binding cassette domain-containing protein [Alphaproteobacteria bacterium]
MSAGDILTVAGWSCGYLDEPIVRDLDFSLPAGSITCIVGSNGAGKSTLLRSLYGTIKRFAGTLTFRGERIEQLSPVERMARGMSFVPQGRCNFPYLTVAENLQLAGYTLRPAAARTAIAEQVAKFPLLRRKWRQMAGNLSGGEQQVMEMAMVMVAKPVLMLVDEPSLGLSPRMRDEVFATIKALAAAGLT